MSTPKKIEPAKAVTPAATQPNAWIAKVSADVGAEKFSVALPLTPAMAPAITEGDGIALLSERDGKVLTVTFARIYRVRSGLESTTLYFDAVLAVEPPKEAASLGLPVPTGVIGRVDWPTFTAALKAATGKEFKDCCHWRARRPPNRITCADCCNSR